MPEQKTILVVEDDKAIAEVYEMKLQFEGFNVIIANNGLEALSTIKETVPDLILLDIIMPKMNGFDFLSQLKKDPANQNIKVIIMSNLGQDIDRKRGEELGAVEYIVKSDSNIDEILEKITKHLGG